MQIIKMWIDITLCCLAIFILCLSSGISQKVKILILLSQQLLGEWVRNFQTMKAIGFLVTAQGTCEN